jgi:hypothetical protein
MPKDNGSTTGKRRHRSRITAGAKFLPNVHSQSVWARLMRDKYHALITHCGGDEAISETQRSRARRAAFLEAELVYQEDKVGRLRAEGKEPEPHVLDLYSRLTNTQTRQEEALGWQRTQRDITGEIKQLMEQHTTKECSDE